MRDVELGDLGLSALPHLQSLKEKCMPYNLDKFSRYKPSLITEVLNLLKEPGPNKSDLDYFDLDEKFCFPAVRSAL